MNGMKKVIFTAYISNNVFFFYFKLITNGVGWKTKINKRQKGIKKSGPTIFM